MKRVCAWCGRKLGTVGAEEAEDQPVTHGVCRECAQRTLMKHPKSMREFLDNLGVPILVISSEPRVLTGNKQAAELLDKEIDRMEGRKGGEVIECVWAKSAEGCGQSVHCKSCTIRRTVLDTFETGRSHVSVRAYPDIQLLDEVKCYSVEISTEKAGDVVLLRIDEMAEGEPVLEDVADAKAGLDTDMADDGD